MKALLGAVPARRLYLAVSLISSFLFSMVFTVNLLYHVNTARLNPMQLVLVGTVLEASVFLFEIPTGLVADAVSRKLSIIIGYALIGAGFLLEGLFPSFLAIAVSQVLWGVGYTFTSGATQAWLTGEVGEEAASSAFVDGAQAGQAGSLAAIPLAMLIGLASLSFPIVLGGAGMALLALGLVFAMGETGFQPAERQQRPGIAAATLAMVKPAVQALKRRALVILLAIGFFYGLYSEGFDRLWTPHLESMLNGTLFSTVNSVITFGVLQAAGILLSIGALSWVRRKLDAMGGNVLPLLLAGGAVIVLALAGFGLTHNVVLAALLYFLIGAMRSVTSPLLDAWLNRVVTDNRNKATMFSVRGQVDAVGQIAGGPLVGLVATASSVRLALVASAALLSPVLMFYYTVNKERKNKSS